MPLDGDRAAARRLCEEVLEENWRQGRRQTDGLEFGYTCPSAGHYPWQWYWDSCFAAITWRRYRPERSRQELTSLLGAIREDGFIGHTIFWNTPLRGARRFTYNVLSPGATMTASIQPPGLAWAWRVAVGDPAREPAIAAHHDWLERNRDLDGDGLIWIVQPDESGLDASPQFDPVWRWRAHDLPGFVALVRRNRRLGYDLRRVAARGGPVVCEVLTNVVYSLSRIALGRPSLTPAILERLYDRDSGLFAPLVRPRPAERIPVTWTALAPLALPDLPEDIGRRLVEEHLLDDRRFWLPGGMPSVAADEPSFQRDDRGPWRQHRYWRGPMWINAMWLVWLGLVRLGYDEAAETLTARALAAVTRSGLREYYDPYDSRGLGQPHFAWSTLVLEMIDPDPRAPASYLTEPEQSPA
ncbi:MAG TPA: hypothetical protein VFP55_03570 [Solirubrobacteraceae bacterium]|nr:hypothetical protein [Solirubrobacteraceae bacterium]